MAVKNNTRNSKKGAAATKKPAAAAKTKHISPMTQDDKTTRELILLKSLELINEKGMVDFRIDTLAQSLKLSPGNITYHFSKKEDICVALWEEYLEKYGQVQRTLTTLLDIKQLYLINRINIELNYKYRGVVVFRSADLGAMQRDLEIGRINEEEHFKISQQVMELLGQNGYLNTDVHDNIIEAIHIYHYIMMRWCTNFAYQVFQSSEVKGKLDYLALLSLHALYPTFSKKGTEQFKYIMDTVVGGHLLGNNNNDK